MKKFISAITAIAMTAGVMASMTVVANAESTKVEAESVVLSTKKINNNCSIVENTKNEKTGIQWYINGEVPVATLFKIDNNVKNGDEVKVTINLDNQSSNIAADNSIEYGIFISDEEITLSSIEQDAVKESFNGCNAIGGMQYFTAKNKPASVDVSGTADSDGSLYVYIGVGDAPLQDGKVSGGKIQFTVDYFDVEVTSSSVEPPAPPTETKYYTVDLGDNAGSYTKVSVTANNGEKNATVTKDLESTLTLAEAAGVSLGIAITDIPTGETFTIESVTLE